MLFVFFASGMVAMFIDFLSGWNFFRYNKYNSYGKKITPIDNHNPLLYTWLWQWLYSLGGLLEFNEYQVFFSCTIFQTVLMAMVVSCFLYSLYKKGYLKRIIILSTLYYGLLNLIPLYLVSLWKDTPFAAFFFGFSVLLFQ